MVAQGQHWRIDDSRAMVERRLAGRRVRVCFVMRTRDPACSVAWCRVVGEPSEHPRSRWRECSVLLSHLAAPEP
jgi:hypothetical protein